MRDADNLETMEGFNYLASVPEGETIVGMVEVDGYLIVATDKHIYELTDEKRLELISLD